MLDNLLRATDAFTSVLLENTDENDVEPATDHSPTPLHCMRWDDSRGRIDRADVASSTAHHDPPSGAPRRQFHILLEHLVVSRSLVAPASGSVPLSAFVSPGGCRSDLSHHHTPVVATRIRAGAQSAVTDRF